MSYSKHFILTDDLIRHLDSVFSGLNDPFLESRYTGFLAISSVTVLELALKDIFCDFALAKHKVLGHFTSQHFDRINGRISLKNVKSDYVSRFGEKYRIRFDRKIQEIEIYHLKTNRRSLCASYGNLLTWRHSFAHEGILPSNASYAEVKNGYESGKEIMHCLDSCMRR